MFCLDKDKISFHYLDGIYEKLEISSELKNSFKKIRGDLNEFLDSNSSVNIISISRGESKTFTRREIQDIFIYGGILHIEPRKKKVYDYLMRKPFLKQSSTNDFVEILGIVLWSIQAIADL
jgi:hypothetical protein